MVKVDIAEIEKLIDVLTKTASDSDEALNKLRHISSEMQADTELPLYTQTDVLLEAISMALDALTRGNDMLQSLKNVMLPVATTYCETEQINKDALNRMLVVMDSASVGFNSAIVSNSIPKLEHTDSIATQNRVQQLVADSVDELQVTNIAAVTKVVKDEYEVKAIRDLK